MTTSKFIVEARAVQISEHERARRLTAAFDVLMTPPETAVNSQPTQDNQAALLAMVAKLALAELPEYRQRKAARGAANEHDAGNCEETAVCGH